MNINIEEWSHPNFRPINKFYRSQKHKGSASGDERIFYILEKKLPDNIIAAVRLVPYEGYYWLRSLYVKEDIRGQALGSQLLTFVQDQILLPIYCFPYDHLLNFYQKNAYTVSNHADLPEALASLFKRYKDKGQKIICMETNTQVKR